MGVIIVPASGHYKNKLRHYLYLPGGSVIKKSPAKQEKWVPSLGQEDPLEKGIKIHSSILAWETPWTEEPGRLESMGSQESEIADKQQHYLHSSAWHISNYHQIVTFVINSLLKWM